MSPTEVIVVSGHRAASRAVAAARIARRAGCARMPASPLPVPPADPAREALGAIGVAHPPRVVLELPEDGCIESTIGMFADAEDARIAEAICVVDAASFFEDLFGDEYYPIAGAQPRLVVAKALRLVQQVEHASAVHIMGWEPIATADLSILLATLSAIAPAARLHLEHPTHVEPSAVFDEIVHQPGWVQLLNHEHRPHMTDIRVSAFRYEQVRPFHPGRLHRLLERMGSGAFGAVIRSAGFCRLATRPGLVGSWDQVGQMIALQPLARDDGSAGDSLALGQEIGVIGIDLDVVTLEAALDRACLTDAEFSAGAAAWAKIADPFPSWSAVSAAAD